MKTFLILLGVLCIIMGIITKVKKTLFFHQGFAQKDVNLDKYTNYFFWVDLGIGACLILLALISGSISISLKMPVLFIAIAYLFLNVYADTLFKKKG